MNETVIEFEDVCKSYPLYHHVTGGIKHFIFHLPDAIRSLRKTRFDALKDISFSVKRGESFGVIGRNGAGKSTLLGLMAGVLEPSAGTIHVSGRISPLLELGGGFHPDLSGRENIVLNGVLLGMLKRETLDKLDEIIAFSGLEQFIDQPIRTYSTGMVSRLGFSVVAHLDPEILLIDEVLAVGDVEFQQKCLDKLQEFRRTGVTIVLVSHGLEDVRRICDRAMWIDEHRARIVDTPDEVIRCYAPRIS